MVTPPPDLMTGAHRETDCHRQTKPQGGCNEYAAPCGGDDLTNNNKLSLCPACWELPSVKGQTPADSRATTRSRGSRRSGLSRHCCHSVAAHRLHHEIFEVLTQVSHQSLAGTAFWSPAGALNQTVLMRRGELSCQHDAEGWASRFVGASAGWCWEALFYKPSQK